MPSDLPRQERRDKYVVGIEQGLTVAKVDDPPRPAQEGEKPSCGHRNIRLDRFCSCVSVGNRVWRSECGASWRAHEIGICCPACGRRWRFGGEPPRPAQEGKHEPWCRQNVLVARHICMCCGKDVGEHPPCVSVERLAREAKGQAREARMCDAGMKATRRYVVVVLRCLIREAKEAKP